MISRHSADRQTDRASHKSTRTMSPRFSTREHVMNLAAAVLDSKHKNNSRAAAQPTTQAVGARKG